MLVKYVVSSVGLALAAHSFGQVVEPPLVLTLRLHVFGFFGLTTLLWKGQGLSLFKAIPASITLSLLYVITLLSSIAIYRLYLHRLHRFPGETIHKLTMFSWLPIDWKGQRPSHIQALHTKYGSIVRIGPRQLSIADYKAASSIYTLVRCPRGPYYPAQHSMSSSSTNLQTELNHDKHMNRRKDWQRALSKDALMQYQQRISVLVEDVVKHLQAKLVQKEGMQLDIVEYLTRFSLDAAVTIGTGTTLGLLGKVELPSMIQPLDERLRLLNTLSYVPYCMEAVHLIPSSTRKFDNWIASTVKDCSTTNDSKQQSSSALVDYLRGEKEEQLISDVSTFIIHSSETIKSTLTWAIFELINQPLLLGRLQKELDSIFKREKSTTTEYFSHLEQECPLLDACIKETWRLWPPVPSGLQRVTPFQGRKISNDLHLPANVIVSVPTYTIQRDPANFSSPNQFQPTRWLPKESTAKNHQLAAFSPFGYGQDDSKCIGQELALMQCRIMLASLIQSFNISPVKDKEAFKTEYRDQYTIANTLCLIEIASR